MTRFLGIDPGLGGALAFYENGELVQLEDMPVFKIGKKRILDGLALARIIDAYTSGVPTDVWLEFVASSPQMGVASAFKFGEGYGIIRGVLAANFLHVEHVTPAKWKAAFRLGKDKDDARRAASREFPRQSALFGRVKDHGRAEAALIALYGARQSARAAA